MMGEETESLLSERQNGCGNSILCDPTRKPHRYLMLIFICFLLFGSYFCFDNPAALQDIMLRDLDINESQFMTFYAIYSWPNVVLCFVGGFLIDRFFGIRLGAIIFSTFVLVSQFLFGTGALIKSLVLMNIGRFVLGIGGESLAVAVNAYCTRWFKSNEINFVFGLQLSVSRIGSTVNMNTMQPLYNYLAKKYNAAGYKTLGMALLIVSVTCVFSWLCAVIMSFFDFRAEKIWAKQKLKQNLEQCENNQIQSAGVTLDGTAEDSDLVSVNDIHEVEEKPEEEKINLKDVLRFPMSFWLICIICVAYYVTVFPFISLGLTFFEYKYDLVPAKANAINSIVYIVSAVASPIFGAAIDFSGKNIFWLTLGIVTTLTCHAIFAFTFEIIPPMATMVIMGLSYSVLASSLWPMIALILPAHQLGTAYGMIQAIQNLGLAVISILAGVILDAKGYFFLELFFISWLYIALGATFALLMWDMNNGSVMNESGAKRRAKLRNEVEV